MFDGVIVDFGDLDIVNKVLQCGVPFVAAGNSYTETSYPYCNYVATNNLSLSDWRLITF
ncbi:hypothetical protein [Klebsiella oxytoca]|uniref:hypothetical protein n=1 Tax=Klebsiella oxytoca TaxID=571 RepID=UPI0035CCD474